MKTVQGMLAEANAEVPRISPEDAKALVGQPDVVFIASKNFSKRGNKMWEGADLVIEIVSEDDPCVCRV